MGISTLFLVACEAPKEIGLPPEVIAEVKLIDTFTVKTSTVLLDSVRTSNALQLLAGAYNDPIFGQVSTQPYFELGGILNLNADGNTKTYVYDSLTLNIAYNYLYGDTLQPFELHLHRLRDTIQSNKTYYNNSTISFDPTPIATVRTRPAPSTNPTVRFKLPNSFGRQIFDLSGKPEASSANLFVQNIKGFTIVPKTPNGMVIGINTINISLNLYVRATDDTIPLRRSFPLIRRFNTTKANRQATALASIQPLTPLTPAQANGLVYVQDAVGIVTKIEFPFLSKMLRENPVAVNRAELTITPEQPRNIGGIFGLPPGMVMAETDRTNRLLRSRGGTELLLPEDGTTFQNFILPQVAIYDSRFRNYNFVLTTYLQAIATGFKRTEGLLLMPASSFETLRSLSNPPNIRPLSLYAPYLNHRIDRMTINPTRDNIKLMVFYTVVR
ncbi:MAG: DUF4270 family protein [Runella sp.]